MLPRFAIPAGLGVFLPRFSLGFLPALAPLLSAAGPLLGGAGGGGGAPAAPPQPINTTANFGAVSFGAKYLGDSAVKAAPAIIAAEKPTPAWMRVIPWAVGGVVALFALILLIPRRSAK